MTPDDPRHGTNAGYSAHQTEGSPACLPCSAAKARYWSDTYRAQAYGRWNPWTDAEPARQHVRSLMAEGVSIKRIAEAAGVDTARISALLYGRGARKPSVKIRPDYSAALLAVEPSAWRVPIFRVARRLGALVALGYSQPYLGKRLGCSQGRVWQYLNEKQTNVSEETFARVDALFRELCMRLPEATTRAEKYAASRSRHTARVNGYDPPLAWINIDDPDEKPRRGSNPGKYRRDELLEEWDHLRRAGLSMEEAAARLGLTVDAIEAAVYRSNHTRGGAA